MEISPRSLVPACGDQGNERMIAIRMVDRSLAPEPDYDPANYLNYKREDLPWSYLTPYYRAGFPQRHRVGPLACLNL